MQFVEYNDYDIQSLINTYSLYSKSTQIEEYKKILAERRLQAKYLERPEFIGRITTIVSETDTYRRESIKNGEVFGSYPETDNYKTYEIYEAKLVKNMLKYMESGDIKPVDDAITEFKEKITGPTGIIQTYYRQVEAEKEAAAKRRKEAEEQEAKERKERDEAAIKRRKEAEEQEAKEKREREEAGRLRREKEAKEEAARKKADEEASEKRRKEAAAKAEAEFKEQQKVAEERTRKLKIEAEKKKERDNQ
jgi:hypothetical protein